MDDALKIRGNKYYDLVAVCTPYQKVWVRVGAHVIPKRHLVNSSQRSHLCRLYCIWDNNLSVIIQDAWTYARIVIKNDSAADPEKSFGWQSCSWATKKVFACSNAPDFPWKS